MKDVLPVMSRQKKTKKAFEQLSDQPDTVRSQYKTARESSREEKNSERHAKTENVHVVVHETSYESVERKPVLKKIKASNV